MTLSSKKVATILTFRSLYNFQGAVGDFFYIIRSGEVDITKNNANGGEDNIVVLGPGESFGEKALIREDKRNANARAKTEVKCYTLDRKGKFVPCGERQA